MLFRTVIRDEIHDDLHVSLVRSCHKCFEVLKVSIVGVHIAVVSNIIPIILLRCWVPLYSSPSFILQHPPYEHTFKGDG